MGLNSKKLGNRKKLQLFPTSSCRFPAEKIILHAPDFNTNAQFFKNVRVRSANFVFLEKKFLTKKNLAYQKIIERLKFESGAIVFLPPRPHAQHALLGGPSQQLLCVRFVARRFWCAMSLD